VAPRACVRVYARVLVPPNLYIHTYRHEQALVSMRNNLTANVEGRQPMAIIIEGG